MRFELARSSSSGEITPSGAGVLDAPYLRRHRKPRLSGLALYLRQHPFAPSGELLDLFAVHLVGVELGPVRTAEPFLPSS